MKEHLICVLSLSTVSFRVIYSKTQQLRGQVAEAIT